MIDLLLHNLRTIGTHHCDGTVGEEAADEIERLRAEVAGLREDAERYRWLRDPHNQDCHSVGKCAPGIERYEAIDWLYDDELDVSIDSAIDAALAARKGTTPTTPPPSPSPRS